MFPDYPFIVTMVKRKKARRNIKNIWIHTNLEYIHV